MGLPTKGAGSPSISWTYEGDATEAAKWLPYAVGLLRAYANKGIPKGNNSPEANVNINFDAMTGRIHIQAGGNKAYIYLPDSAAATADYPYTAVLFRNPSPPDAFGSVGVDSTALYTLTGSVLAANNIYAMPSIKHKDTRAYQHYWKSKQQEVISWDTNNLQNVAYQGTEFNTSIAGVAAPAQYSIASTKQTTYFFSQMPADQRTKYADSGWSYAFLLLTCSNRVTSTTPYGFSFTFIPVYKKYSEYYKKYNYRAGYSTDVLQSFVENDLFYRVDADSPIVSTNIIGFSEDSAYFFLYTTETKHMIEPYWSWYKITNKIIRVTILPADTGLWTPVVESIKTCGPSTYSYVESHDGDTQNTWINSSNYNVTSWSTTSTQFNSDTGFGEVVAAGLVGATKTTPSYLYVLYRDDTAQNLVNSFNSNYTEDAYTTSYPFVSAASNGEEIVIYDGGTYTGWTVSTSGSSEERVALGFTSTLKLGRINTTTKEELPATTLAAASGEYSHEQTSQGGYYLSNQSAALKAQIATTNAYLQVAAQDMNPPDLIPYPYNPNGEWPMTTGYYDYSGPSTNTYAHEESVSVTICNFDGGVFYTTTSETTRGPTITTASYSATANPEYGYSGVGPWLNPVSTNDSTTPGTTSETKESIRNQQGVDTEVLSTTSQHIASSSYGGYRDDFYNGREGYGTLTPSRVASASATIGSNWADNGDVMVVLTNPTSTTTKISVVNSHSNSPETQKEYIQQSNIGTVSVSNIRK